MDAALSAILGGLAGGLLTLIASALSAQYTVRRQNRMQIEQQQRQLRERLYRDYLREARECMLRVADSGYFADPSDREQLWKQAQQHSENAALISHDIALVDSEEQIRHLAGDFPSLGQPDEFVNLDHEELTVLVRSIESKYKSARQEFRENLGFTE